jgi:microcystin degradation protein MlrC
MKAWVRVPVLLPGEKACTRDQPARSIYGGLAELERRAGIIDAAVWIGYAWADEPRCSAAVVVTGTDADVIAREARGLAEKYWNARSRFAFSTAAGDTDWCIATGLASRDRPFFISDSGDNPTAGGAGDVAFMLERLLSNPALASGRATAIWASVVDPSAVARCMAIGEGAIVDLRVGGAFGSLEGAGVALRGAVARLWVDPVGGDIAVVASGGVCAILSSRRKPFHFIRDFTRLGLDPATCDLTVVKVGYLVPDLFDAAKGSLLALTPGGVDQDILRLAHARLDRPIYPLDPGMPTPDLTAVIVH